MSISEALYQFLKQSQVASLVGTRIYPSIIDTRVGFPAIGYEVQDVAPVMCMRGEAGLAKATITLTCWANDSLTAGLVAEAVRQVFSGLRGSLGGVYCRLATVGDFADVVYTDPEAAELFKAGKQTELNIWHTQSVPTPAGV